MNLAELLTGVWVRGELRKRGDSKAVVVSLKSSPQMGLWLIKAATQKHFAGLSGSWTEESLFSRATDKLCKSWVPCES